MLIPSIAGLIEGLKKGRGRLSLMLLLASERGYSAFCIELRSPLSYVLFAEHITPTQRADLHDHRSDSDVECDWNATETSGEWRSSITSIPAAD